MRWKPGEKPDVLVEVITTEEVSKIMKYATTRKFPIYLVKYQEDRGTGLVGASVPIYGGIMIEFD